MAQYAQVVVLVEDLRSEPTSEPRISNGHDRRRNSQVLRGSYVVVLEEQEGWCRVHVPDQMTGHYVGAIHPYEGWVKSTSLRKGVQLDRHNQICVLTEEKRAQIVAAARSYIDEPYLWGGLSHHEPSYMACQTGIDCSGLTLRSYEVAGQQLPRDSKDQWQVSVPTLALEPADLLFSSPPDRPVNHVMLWTGHAIIEATDADKRVVREIAFEEKFGIPLQSITAPSVPIQTGILYLRRFPGVSNRH